MEYITLENQQNTYPSIENYKKTSIDIITLTGNFKVNKLEFKVPELDTVLIVPETKFRFLLYIDDKLYTSPLFYNELITSYNESNPYFLESGFNPNFVVKFSTNEIASIVAKLKVLEKGKNINFKKNIFILENGEYDYKYLIKYIDWLVSPVGLSEIETNGVLPAKSLSEYTLPKIERPPSLETDVSTTTVVRETVQVFQYEYIRVRNLDREPLAVRQERRTNATEIYRINEGNKFFGRFLGSGDYEIFDDSRNARTGYVLTSAAGEFSRFKRIGGPFSVTILTSQTSTPTGQNNNTNTNNQPPNTQSGDSSGGGGSSYGGGYGSGDTSMRPNMRYQR